MSDHCAAHIDPMLLQPSYRLAAILIVAHTAAGALLLTLPLPSWTAIVGVLTLLPSMTWAVHRHALRRGCGAIAGLQFSDRETVQMTLRDGSVHSGHVLGSSTIGRQLTVLNIRLDGRRLPVSVVLLADSLDAGDFRRLRVWLRWGPRPPADELLIR